MCANFADGNMMQDIFKEIAASTAQSIGVPFLLGMVKSMRFAMEANLVFLTVGVGKPPSRARTICSWQEDSGEESFEYDLEGTPCRIVYDGQTVTVAEGLYKQFPFHDGYEGYVGVPIRQMYGSPKGHLAVLSRRPIEMPREAMAIVQIFAIRAEAEMQRLELQKELEANVASLSMATRRLS